MLVHADEDHLVTVSSDHGASNVTHAMKIPMEVVLGVEEVDDASSE
jgi:hypothetical protein